MKPWKLADNNYGHVKNQKYEVAVLPLGATEPHNLHLPYGTDLFEASIVGDKICEAAHLAGAKVVLLPTIPFGTETNLREFPLAINLNPSTLHMVIRDIVDSLLNDGIKKIVLLNSHGGTGFKPLLREKTGKNEARVCLCNWYEGREADKIDAIEKPENQAGEMETSFGLAFFPELVAKNPDGTLNADDGSTRDAKLEALNRGWVSITRPWHLLTQNSGAADPHAATEEKGQKMMDVLVERLGKFLVELSDEQITDQFPY